VVVKASAAPTAFYLGNIDVKDSLTYVGPSVVAANALTITAHTGSTALNVDLTGGVAVDTFTLNGIATNTSITVKGDLKASTDTLTINASASTVSGGQTIDVSGLVSTNVTITGSTTVKDTIKGSAGNDIITARGGADEIDISQGGTDTIILRSPAQDTGAVTSITDSSGVSASLASGTVFVAGSYVSTTAMDKITGFAAGDIIQANSVAAEPSSVTVLQTLGSARGTSAGSKYLDGTAVGNINQVIDLFVQGNYDASANRFTFSSSGKDTLYLLDDDATAGGSTMYGIVLVGYVTGGTTVDGAATGMVGAALPS
jgi:hypothetical protein